MNTISLMVASSLAKNEARVVCRLSPTQDNHFLEQADLGTLSDLKQAFGGSLQDILDAFLALQHELQHELYHCA